MYKEADTLIADDKPQEAGELLQAKIVEYHQWSNDHPKMNSSNFNQRFLYTQLAKAQEAAGAELDEIIATYKKVVLSKSTNYESGKHMMGMVIIAGYFVATDRLPLGKTISMIIAAMALALVLNLGRIIITMEFYLHNLKNYAEGRWHGLLGIFIFLIGYTLLSKLSKQLQNASK